MSANLLQLDILRQLREEAGLTQDDMARLCGLAGQMRRQTAGAWERGDIIPSRARRNRIIRYLWDHLRLRRDPARFDAVWDVLMQAWGWEPISDKEWASFTSVARPARRDEVAQQLAALASTVQELQQGSRTAPSTPTITSPTAWQLPLDALPAHAPLPPHSRMALGRNPHFVGRESALLALAAAFTRGDTAAISQVATAAATGMGGIGKTQLASEFVHRYGQFFAGGVFWLNFDHADAVSSEFAACGGAGALDLRPDFASRPLDEQVRLVQAAFQEPTPRLLVFDNCEDPALLVRWRPASGGCRILITSRNQEWELALGVQTHALGVLQRAESLQLLRQHHVAADPATLDAIATELGDLPLALHLAGSYLHRYRRVLTAEQYLACLRDPALPHHPSLQSAGPSPTGHVQHVARTFALSCERLDPAVEVDARAQRLLAHMAILAPGEPVPYALLGETLALDVADPQQAVLLEAAVVRLLELGLVSVDEAHQLWLHRLVANFVRAGDMQLTRAAWDAAVAQVEATIQAKLDDYYRSIKPLPLLPIQTHLRHVVDCALLRQDAAGATLSLALARYLWGLGEYGDALQYTERALRIRQTREGAQHEEIAQCHHLMGILLGEVGRFAAAHEHLQTALAARLHAVGECHFDVADTLVNLAELYWAEQKLAPALATLRRALHICDEVVERDAPLVAEITMMLGLCMFDAGEDVDQAQHYLHEALRIRRQTLGEDHPYTATAYTNLGYLLHQIGALDEADHYYMTGLVIRQRVCGDTHLDTAHSLYCLGKLRRMQARWDEASAYLHQAFAIYRESQGEEYFFTASCLNELGVTRLALGDLEVACGYLTRALTTRQKTYAADHPHIADTLHNLGTVRLAQGQLALAREHLRQALAIRQRRDAALNRVEAVELADTCFALGQVAEQCDTLPDAHAWYRQSHALYAQYLGDEHTVTLRVAAALARLQARA